MGPLMEVLDHPEPLKEVDQWLETYRQFFEESFDRLDEYLNRIQRKEKEDGGK